MAGTNDHRGLWTLVAAQHGVISYEQLAALGYGRHAIDHRALRGRLHRRARGVYAVGRPDLTRHGELMVAVLSCGAGAYVSDHTATEALGIRRRCPGPIEVTCRVKRARDGVTVHRRCLAVEDRGTIQGIPVTSPARTLVDVAPTLSDEALERAVNVADSLDLIDPETLRAACDRLAGVTGVAKLRRVLDRHTFRATDSVLEQRFLAIVRRTSLPLPVTQRHADGYRVDFLWPGLGLVVEADSLRYHRTPSQQRRDRLRDQAHHDAGRTPRRFTHAQIFFESESVARSLQATAGRLEPAP